MLPNRNSQCLRFIGEVLHTDVPTSNWLYTKASLINPQLVQACDAYWSHIYCRDLTYEHGDGYKIINHILGNPVHRQILLDDLNINRLVLKDFMDLYKLLRGILGDE